MEIRHAQPNDYAPIIAVLDDWWGGRPMRAMLPKLFFTHFANTSFVATQAPQICGFLIGFLSQTRPDEAYIHFVGIHPAHRQQGLGRTLYTRFFATVRQHQRHIVRCVTAPSNQNSIAFHQRLGFQAEPQTTEQAGIPFYPNYDGNGEHRVLFTKHLL